MFYLVCTVRMALCRGFALRMERDIQNYISILFDREKETMRTFLRVKRMIRMVKILLEFTQSNTCVFILTMII